MTELLEKGHRGEILKYQTRYVSLWATKSVAKLNFFVEVSSQKLAVADKRINTLPFSLQNGRS